MCPMMFLLFRILFLPLCNHFFFFQPLQFLFVCFFQPSYSFYFLPCNYLFHCLQTPLFLPFCPGNPFKFCFSRYSCFSRRFCLPVRLVSIVNVGSGEFLMNYRPIVRITLSRASLGISRVKACSCALNLRACQVIANSFSLIPENAPKEITAQTILQSWRSIINYSILPRSSPAVLTTLSVFIVPADQNSGVSLPDTFSVRSILSASVLSLSSWAILSFCVSACLFASIRYLSSCANLSLLASACLSGSIRCLSSCEIFLFRFPD